MDWLLEPTLSLGAQAFVRVAYGVLLLSTLAQAIPQAPRFFATATHGGYLDPSPIRDALLRPATAPILLAIWIACAVAIALDVATPIAALANALLCWWFFVRTRWSGILRGMGAPGFMSWWLGTAVLALELARRDGSGLARPAVAFAFRADFAAIMICAGTYKAFAGYRSNDGIELGLANPWWGYAWSRWMRLRPSSPIFRLANTAAWTVQIGAGALLLTPAREVGALAIAASFAGIAALIRLGFLCEMVIAAALLCVPEGGPTDRALASLVAPSAAAPIGVDFGRALFVAALGYAALLPLAKAGLYWNFYGRRRLAAPIQAALDLYTNLFGIIIWRVFTVDVICFFARVSVRDASGAARVYSRPGALDWASRFRYLHVGEFICTASIFTTLKYHASQRALFEEKLVRYARTIPCPEGSVVSFEYVLIKKLADRFEHAPVSVFDVEPRAGIVAERVIDPSVSLAAAGAASPVHEGARPGSYAPPAPTASER